MARKEGTLEPTSPHPHLLVFRSRILELCDRSDCPHGIYQQECRRLLRSFSSDPRYITGVIASIAAGIVLSLSLYSVGSHAYDWLGKAPVKSEPKVSSTTILKTADNTVVDLRVVTPARSTVEEPSHERPEVNDAIKTDARRIDSSSSASHRLDTGDTRFFAFLFFDRRI